MLAKHTSAITHQGPACLDAVFQTSDIDVATYVHARSYPVLRLDRVGDHMVFTFPAEAASSMEAFYMGATISAKALLHSFRQIDYMRNHRANDQYFA